MGLATWVVITLVEIQVIVMMLQQELMDLDKVIGRIYHHMDRLSQKCDGGVTYYLVVLYGECYLGLQIQ